MNATITTATWGKKAVPHGRPPALALIDPKYPHNVGMVVRLASCYGFRQVWFTGDRVSLDPVGGGRLPREERMKGYRDVEVIHHEHPFDQFPPGAVPVAVEVRAGSEPLHAFDHPDDAVYVFGPEDGSIPKALLGHCHRFLVIPTRHCLNLATAAATVLWDREFKRWQAGKVEAPITPGEYEARGIVEAPADLVFSTR
jgi:tRNA(Leu) C34 or U34 (ribose-2'-O)-methylase TrmL